MLSLALPLNGLIATTIWQLGASASKTQRTTLAFTSRAVATAIDAQLGKYIGLAQALAVSPSLLTEDLTAFEQEARQRLTQTSDAWILVADLDGYQLLNTGAKPNQPLADRSASGFAAQKRALQRRALTVSDDIWIGPVAGTYIATIEVPIFKNGLPYRALTIVMTLGGFQKLLQGQQIPTGWLTAIVDGDGRFLARVPNEGRQVGELASAGWRKIIAQDGIFEFKSLEGADLVHANSHPALVNWSVGIAADRTRFRAATWEVVRRTAVPAFLLSALSLMFAYFIGRRVTGPLNSLRDNVPALMQGANIELHEGSPEIRELAVALHNAGLERQHAEDVTLRLAAIVRSSFDAIVSKTLDGVITSWNASAEMLFGYTSSDAIGKNIRMLIPADRQHEEDEIQLKLARNDRVEPFETVRVHKEGHHIPVSITISPIADMSGRVVGASKIARDVTERNAREQQVQFLLGELNHRSKNVLAVIQAIAQRTEGSSPEFMRAFSERLRALSINQDLLANNEWHGVLVDSLVKAQLQSFVDSASARIKIDGMPVQLNANAAQALGMALHELATNACKYGALSNATGTIGVTWRVIDDTFELSWAESGGPVVNQPTRRGFGSLVVSTMVEKSLQGQVELEHAPEGLRWRVKCPAGEVLEPGLAAP